MDTTTAQEKEAAPMNVDEGQDAAAEANNNTTGTSPTGKPSSGSPSSSSPMMIDVESDVGSVAAAAASSAPAPPSSSNSPVSSATATNTASSSKTNSTVLPIDEAKEMLVAALSLPPTPTAAGEKRAKAVGKALVALEAARAQQNQQQQQEQENDDSEEQKELCQAAVDVILAWRNGLVVGTDVDAKSLRDDQWYAGTLKAEQDGADDNKDAARSWVVKFKRFSANHNEVFPNLGAETVRLMPLGSHTGKVVSQRALAEKRQRAEEELRRKEARRENEGASYLAQKPTAVVGTTRSGRTVRTENTAYLAETAKPKAEKAKKEKERQLQQQQQQQQKEDENEDGAAGFHVDTGGNDFNDWVCGTCDEMEKSEGDVLVLCDGPCKRAFHQSCLGLTKDDMEALEEWYCDQCLEKEHTCFVCGDTGKDDGAMDGVHKCQKSHCGKFYHQHCVSQLPNAVIAKSQEEVTGDGQEGEDGQVHFKFVCPLHVCDLCGKGRESTKNRNQLFPCWHCPKAYHLNCIPPTCNYHEYLLLCPDHSHLELPRLPGWEESPSAGSSGDGAGMEGEEVRSDGWLCMVFSTLLPRTKTPFRLPAPLFDEVHSKPQPFGHIPCLKYLCKIPHKEPGPECQCVGRCGDNCLNRMLHIECVGDAGGAGEEGSGGNKKERYHNCNVGPQCGNRAFKNKEYIKHQVFKEGGCGWGLRTLEDVKKGQLVFEYVGEVIDDDLLEARLQEHARDHPNDHNMYIMELESGYYLDARVKGNVSRFINHACAPNCELQKWNVKGFTHIGIMACVDIPAGTSLSYDYQFATNEEGKFKCHCGAPTCRGSLAPKSQVSEEDAMEALRTGSRTDRKKLLELCKKRERREQARKEQEAKQSKAKQNLTSQLLPGDPLLEVRAGPPPKYFSLARETKIFLVRNAKQGDDFLRRSEAWNQREVQMMMEEDSKSSN